MASTGKILRGRRASDRQQWAQAFAELTAADHQSSLDPDDLERLATAAYLLGRDDEAITTWMRLHRFYRDQDAPDHAARWGFWLSLTYLLAGQPAQATGWLSRTKRVVTGYGQKCVEWGYVLFLEGLVAMFGGNSESAAGSFDKSIAIASDFEDGDLLALALLGKGQAVIGLKRQTEGVALLDEAMVGVSAGDVSPILVGIIYCAVISTCQRIFDLGRAREWTIRLNEWCASQPDLIPFRGLCLIHRSEILQLQGDWLAALEEAENACRRLIDQAGTATGRAYYQLGELCRLMGAFDKAGRMFREASRRGCEPQPGSALLLLATKKGNAAASLRGFIDQSGDRRGPLAGLPRARLLGPAVDILLAEGDIEGARALSDELSTLAQESGAAFLLAIAAQSAGSVGLAEGRHDHALASLRDAWTAWQNLQMPYESARVRVLLGRLSEALGEQEEARMHYDAARLVFSRLGAAPDLAELDGLVGAGGGSDRRGLTDREREVLALVANGSSNRQVADLLSISEHTVARHVSNIFGKLGVNSRTQAVVVSKTRNLL